jgi:signal transduction histidine kinase
MISLRRVARWWGSPTRIAGVPYGDLVLGAVLSAFVVFLVAGHHGHPLVLSEMGAIAMTAPVIWRRRAPLAASGAVAAAALANGIAVGSVVRCGAAFPAVLLIAYSAGFRLELGAATAAVGLCLANVAVQTVSDPNLGGLTTLVVLAPFTAGVWAVGREVRSRAAVAALLREHNMELRLRRDQTAAVAVAADRVRVADEFGGLIEQRIEELAALAAEGRHVAGAEPDRARQALGAIEHSGRDTLAQMREIVGALRDDAPVEPQPTLAQLTTLLDRATTSETRLVIDGDPRVLPAGIELSAYRIVEHLLVALQDAPEARIEVHLRFAPEALDLTVSGPAALLGEPSAALAQVRERVALHGGTVSTRSVPKGLETIVRLPIVTAYS